MWGLADGLQEGWDVGQCVLTSFALQRFHDSLSQQCREEEAWVVGALPFKESSQGKASKGCISRPTLQR